MTQWTVKEHEYTSYLECSLLTEFADILPRAVDKRSFMLSNLNTYYSRKSIMC